MNGQALTSDKKQAGRKLLQEDNSLSLKPPSKDNQYRTRGNASPAKISSKLNPHHRMQQCIKLNKPTIHTI